MEYKKEAFGNNQVDMSRIRKNGKLFCPECSGKLTWDKHPIVSEGGFIYRNRLCLSCNALIRTKQSFEDITHVEKSQCIATDVTHQ